MKRIIKFGKEAREKLMEGVELSTNAIRTTLGPRGSSAIIYTNSQPFPLLADDGALVSKCVQAEDQAVNTGCAIIKEVATQADNGGGDGTTSATIIAHAILRDSLDLINKGVSKKNIKDGIMTATKIAKEEIEKITKQVENEEQLKNVAFISSNDKEVAELVGSAVYKVGKYGVVQVEEGTMQETRVIDAAGIKFERGFIDRLLTTDPVKGLFDVQKCRILLLDHELDTAQEAVKILELAITKGLPLLVICNGCRNEAALAYFRTNKQQYGLKLCLVQAPGHGDIKIQHIQDIAAATGATVIGDTTGIGLDMLQADPSKQNCNVDKYVACLGTGNVVVTQNATTIVVNEKSEAAIEAAEKIKKELDREDITPYDRGILEERYANLTSGISVIRVGGSTDTEITAKKVKIDDAKNATVSANKFGYVLGGGSAYLWASKKIYEYLDKGYKDTETTAGFLNGMHIVANALCGVTAQLIENSGVNDPLEMLTKINETLGKEETPKTGFNAITNTMVDMYESGIIDSAKVVMNSLDKAASIAATVITAETLITEEAEHEDKVNYALLNRR